MSELRRSLLEGMSDPFTYFCSPWGSGAAVACSFFILVDVVDVVVVLLVLSVCAAVLSSVLWICEGMGFISIQCTAVAITILSPFRFPVSYFLSSVMG